MSPGLYDDLAYDELPPGLSYSGAKDILRSPALYKWKRQQPKTPSAAMELGTVTHSLILGTPPTWRVIDGGKGVTKRREAARAEGLIPVSADDLEHAQAMAAAVHANAECVEWLDKAPRREVAAIAQDPETGTWVRGFFDALHDESRYGIDVKTGRDGTLADFGRTAYNLGYHIQAGCYSLLMEWLGLPFRSLAFLVVESEPPHFVGVRELDDESLDLGRRRFRRALDIYAECVATDTWPGPAAYQTVSVPYWALRQEGIA